MKINKKGFKKYFNFLLTIVFVGLFVIYFVSNKEDLTAVLSINWRYLIIIAIFTGVLFFLEGIFIKIVLSAFDKTIPIMESFYLSTISRIGNYLLPLRAGAAMRAAYLKKKFEFPYSQFLSTLYGYYIVLFLLYAFCALLSLGYKYIVNEEFYFSVTVFFGMLFLAMLFLSFFKVPVNKLPEFKNTIINKIYGFLKKILEGWNSIISDKSLLLKLCLVTLGNILLNAVIFWVEFYALGISMSISNVILYTCLSGVSLLISITPGSLGLREALFLLTSEYMGLSGQEVMQMALLDRGVMFGLLLFAALFVIIFSNKLNAKDIFKKNSNY